jgi:hypothetical protein
MPLQPLRRCPWRCRCRPCAISGASAERRAPRAPNVGTPAGQRCRRGRGSSAGCFLHGDLRGDAWEAPRMPVPRHLDTRLGGERLHAEQVAAAPRTPQPRRRAGPQCVVVRAGPNSHGLLSLALRSSGRQDGRAAELSSSRRQRRSAQAHGRQPQRWCRGSQQEASSNLTPSLSSARPAGLSSNEAHPCATSPRASPSRRGDHAGDSRPPREQDAAAAAHERRPHLTGTAACCRAAPRQGAADAAQGRSRAPPQAKHATAAQPRSPLVLGPVPRLRLCQSDVDVAHVGPWTSADPLRLGPTPEWHRLDVHPLTITSPRRRHGLESHLQSPPSPPLHHHP